jgi:predicted dehydrogenase
MLLAKSCHDLDILQWILDKKCKKVHSFGSLTYFTEKNAPEGAPVRCFEGGCPISDTCRYASQRVYIDNPHKDWFKGSFRYIMSRAYGSSDEELKRALRDTDYGLCVFHANNDVNDHQIVNMEFEDGETVALSVNAFNIGGRYIRIYGTKGELYANMSDDFITVSTYEDLKTEKIPVVAADEMITGGHGGGDAGIIRDLYDYMVGDYHGFSVADIHTSVANHMIGFAAEESLHNDTVVYVNDFCKKHDFVI